MDNFLITIVLTLFSLTIISFPVFVCSVLTNKKEMTKSMEDFKVIKSSWINKDDDGLCYFKEVKEIKFTKCAIEKLDQFLFEEKLFICKNTIDGIDYLVIYNCNTKDIIKLGKYAIEVIDYYKYPKYDNYDYYEVSRLIDIYEVSLKDKKGKNFANEPTIVDNETIVDKGLDDLTSDLTMKVTYQVNGKEVDIKEILEGYSKYLKIKEIINDNVERFK